MIKHERLETNSGLLLLFIMVIISIGGLIEIVPLFYIDDSIEEVKKEVPMYELDENFNYVTDKRGRPVPVYATDDNGEFLLDARKRKVQATQPVDAVRPYTPLEMLGRNIYVAEGCYNCHSQQIRPMQDEFERYGYYSLAAESQYDRPFQWGSRRIGPDLARVGGKMDNQWHVNHLYRPKSEEPDSIMPAYPWLLKEKLDVETVGQHMKALRLAGVPYSANMDEYKANLEQFGKEVADLLHIDNAKKNLVEEAKEIRKNYIHKDKIDEISKMDALVAYLQVLGTMVEFKQDQGVEFSKFR